MKKFLMITAAALVASPAAAQTSSTWQGQTYEDGFATYQITAPVNSFCKFGATGNQTVLGQNAQNGGSINNGVNPGGDAAFTFDIQNDNDNTVQRADARFDFARFVCNSPFTVTATTTNGGLLNSSQSTTDEDFLERVPYKVLYTNENNPGSGNYTTISGPGTVLLQNSSQATAGAANFSIQVDPIDKLVLQGTYSETILLTMAPTVGGSFSTED